MRNNVIEVEGKQRKINTYKTWNKKGCQTKRNVSKKDIQKNFFLWFVLFFIFVFLLWGGIFFSSFRPPADFQENFTFH